MLIKKTSKNQITLPKKILYEIPSTDYFDISVKENSLVLKPVSVSPASDLGEIRKKIASLGLTENDIDNAIKWARK